MLEYKKKWFMKISLYWQSHRELFNYVSLIISFHFSLFPFWPSFVNPFLDRVVAQSNIWQQWQKRWRSAFRCFHHPITKFATTGQVTLEPCLHPHEVEKTDADTSCNIPVILCSSSRKSWSLLVSAVFCSRALFG